MIPWLKIGLYAAAVAAILAGYFGWQHHERTLGAERIEAADAKALAASRLLKLEQMERDAKANEDAANALRNENDRLAALAARPAPVVRVCRGASNGGGQAPSATSTAGGSVPAAPAGGDVHGVPGGTAAGTDIGPQLQRAMIRADQLSAQVRALLQREAELQRPAH